MKTEYGAVIFDLDGLLIDTESVAFKAWEKAAKEFGYDLDKETYCRLLGRTVPDSKRILQTIYGEEFPFDRCRERRIELSREHFRDHGVSVMRGGIGILEYLSDQNIPRAVATSTRKVEALRKLELAKIDRFLGTGAFGDEIQNGKPSPDIFDLAAERLGVDPATCVVFEDSEAGAEAAFRAGMKCIIVPDLKYPSPEAQKFAHSVVPSLGDGLSLIKEQFSFKG